MADAVGLALRNNRNLINTQLDQEVQKMSLRVAEDKFRPDATIAPYTDYQVFGSNDDLESVESGVATGVSLLVPTGGRFAVVWNQSVNDLDSPTYRSPLTVSFSQPLLKGGGIAVNRASVKTARLNEERNVLSLRSAIMNTKRRDLRCLNAASAASASAFSARPGTIRRPPFETRKG